MHKNKWVAVGAVALFCSSMIQAEVIALNTFTDERGDDISEFSGATSSGFTRTYTNAVTDSRVINRAVPSDGNRVLAEGESAVLTFTFDSTQIQQATHFDNGIGWGFRFGDRMVAVTVKSGEANHTFMGHRYTDSSGFEFNTGGTSVNFHADNGSPDGEYHLAAGNTVEVQTILTRISGTDYEMTVHWGGDSYTSQASFDGGNTDHGIASVFIRSGAQAQAMDVGDHYSISGLTLEVTEQPEEPADIPLNTFSTTTGEQISTLSNSSGTGFQLTLDEAPEDSRVVNRGMLSSARILEEGEWAVLTFTLDSTQIKPDQAGAFGWGFRFGDRSVIITARTGTPQWTFLSHRFTGASGFEFATHSSDETKNFHTSDYAIPSSNSWFEAGNTVEVETILKRIEGTTYEVVVNWGGRTYSSTAVNFTGGGAHELQSVFFRSGTQTGAVNDPGDQYSISNVELKVIPEIIDTVLTGIRYTGSDQFDIFYTGEPGMNYVLQETRSLLDPWQDVGEPFLCEPGTNVISTTQAESPSFWRLRKEL